MDLTHFERKLRRQYQIGWLRSHAWKIALISALYLWAYLHQL